MRYSWTTAQSSSADIANQETCVHESAHTSPTYTCWRWTGGCPPDHRKHPVRGAPTASRIGSDCFPDAPVPAGGAWFHVDLPSRRLVAHNYHYTVRRTGGGGIGQWRLIVPAGPGVAGRRHTGK